MRGQTAKQVVLFNKLISRKLGGERLDATRERSPVMRVNSFPKDRALTSGDKTL